MSIIPADLDNAGQDIAFIDAIANQPSGTVSNRLGTAVKTVAQVIQDLGEVDIGDEAAAQINQRINSNETAITALDNRTTQEVNNRIAAVSAEQAARISAVLAVDGRVTQEITDRSVAITAAIANLLDSAPGALDTLNELAAAMGDDPNFAATVMNLITTEQTDRVAAVLGVIGANPASFILNTLKRVSQALGDDPNFGTNVSSAIDSLGDTSFLLGRDAANQTRSRSVVDTPHNLSIASLNAVRCLLLVYGQSLGNGQEAFPVVTGTATPNTFMIGQSVRPTTFDQPSWAPIGGAALNPLIATVEAQVNTGRVPLTSGQVAALPVHDSAEGESPIVAVTRQVARSWYSYGDKPARKFVAAACGVGGRLIENLLKGASPNLYQRVIDVVTAHKTLGDAAGESTNVGAILWMQGEWNYIYGPSDKADHKAKLAQLRNTLDADIAIITGQSSPPLFMTYVTSGQYMDDADHASISMAQVEFALETPGVVCVGPAYPVTDKGGHLTADGSRWFGAMAAKVASRMLVSRLAWEPLYPLSIEQDGPNIYVHHHVPAAPLRFSPAYDETASQLYADFGFQVSDNAGNVPISSVSIIGATIVRIVCARNPGAGATVVYADKTVHDGNGNLCDSDPARSEDNSIASGQPYPLANWCSPYSLPVGYSRA